MNRRIWTACFLFGLILGPIALLLFLCSESWWLIISLFFYVIHFIGLFKLKPYLLNGDYENPNLRR